MAFNTSYGSNYWGIYSGAYEGSGTALFQNNKVENNISLASAQSSNLYVDLGGNNDGTYGTGNVYQNNSLGVQGTNFAFYCITSGTGCSGGLVSTYAALDTAYGSAMNNLTRDPQLAQPAAFDFSLQRSSPAIQSGLPIAGYSSALALPDLGAFQTQQLNAGANGIPTGIPVTYSCGATTGTATCANTSGGSTARTIFGIATLASNSAVISGISPAFTSTSTFACVANDLTTRANPVQVANTSTTSITITNTTGASDVINWSCVGY
jgi:hypothetical protein